MAPTHDKTEDTEPGEAGNMTSTKAHNRIRMRPLWGAALAAVCGVCASAALALPPLLGLLAAPVWTALSLLRDLYADLRILHLRGSFGFHK